MNTCAGWLDGEEVVEVTFDPRITTFGEVLAASRRVAKPSTVFAETSDRAAAVRVAGVDKVRPWKPAQPAKESDRWYHLSRSPYRDLPLTPIQAVRLNALLAGPRAEAKDPDLSGILSPAQLALARRFAAAKPEARGVLAGEVAELRARLAR